MNKVKLEPCPCGGEVKLKYVGIYRIICCKCRHSYGFYDDTDKSEIAKKWNQYRRKTEL